ncbi:MAG: hypothetical protein J6A49_02000 [Clostridia bacterium]|nr:hypothetical protein [Clostridia bacterium]
MKKAIKIIICVALAVIVAVLGVFSPYLLSFVEYDKDFDITQGESVLSDYTEIAVSKDGLLTTNIELSENDCGWFNYYGLEYTADCYIKVTLYYSAGIEDKKEDFFLEPTEQKKTFYSFVDNAIEGKKGNKVKSLTVQTLTKGKENIKIYGFSVFNREIPEQEIYIESENLKLGIDLLWGGALSYLEDTDSNVQAVSVDGKIKVDSNAEERYNAKSVNDNVNLINRNDTGRLVQQSYYGTLEYDHGVYMDNDWRYNPVQGGNQFNDASKIVDLKVNEDSIYIKCRPLDWAKEKEFITPSYMEATYSFENGMVHAKCRFVDFSGYPEAESTQEIPAFYCIEPFNNFVYYPGDKPWTNGELKSEPDLIFWPDANYPTFRSKENWAAFTGEFEDSFGIGLYVPDEESFLAGIFDRENTDEEDPSRDAPTSYIAVTKTRIFKSFDPYEYEYYLATGDSQEIRDTFKNIGK